MYSEFQMNDYVCRDLSELKKLIVDKNFTNEEVDSVRDYLSVDLNINLNSFINKFEFQECYSTFVYSSEKFLKIK